MRDRDGGRRGGTVRVALHPAALARSRPAPGPLPARAGPGRRSVRVAAVPRVVVDVTLKPEILDPQGQAILSALTRLGYAGVSGVRQGKHFELDVDAGVAESAVAEIAETLLANPVIEDFTIRRS